MVAESEVGYDAGLHCKWRVRTSDVSATLKLEVIQAHVYPVTKNCDFDGFVILTQNNTTYGMRVALQLYHQVIQINISEGDL